MKKKGLRKLLVFFSTFFLIFLGLVFGYGYYFTNKTYGKNDKFNKPVNVLVLGVDAGNDKNNHKRSDTIMLVNYNPKINKVFLLSIPRDTRVKINGEYEKINAAHSIGGTYLTIEVIRGLLGVNIDYYIEIDYEGFKKAVDAVGGVDVIVPRDMHYKSHDIEINFKKGEKVHLNGDLAEKFIRWRKNNDGTGYPMGDLGRISTQQEFLKLIFAKLKTPQGMIRVPMLINTLLKYTKTNIPYDLMTYYAYKGLKVDLNSIENYTLKGEPKYISGISYFIYDEEKNREIISKFKDDDIKTRIVILNSTKVNGLARKYKEKLEDLGLDIEVGNYSSLLYETQINTSNIEIAKKIKQNLKIGKINYLKDVKDEIIIILGKDAIK
ncbi:transcriptional attenuator, LytR family [Caloramator fervidus]|uniref:Transcriptional attenuator, LytR family n=1 Tax=Caloramator fervidus TaxID=29344 RepID=A0A1H5VQ14_9CLOT|nr:LCP family protein [Caloramator fervidus]SEF89253.1 transcriptional attenuator, LytR family [Caloramator fervidus]